MQTATSKTEGNVLTLEIFDTESRPSWQRTGTGRAALRTISHRQAKWVSLTVGEYPEKGVTRETSFTLREEAARALLAHLHAVLGE